VTKPPIDLRTVAGKRYQVEYEESHRGKRDDPWLLIIPCQRGHVYVFSSELLGVATDGRKIAQRIAKLPGAEIWQEADDGMNVLFPLKAFPQVAKLVKPKRKRKLTEKQRNRRASQGTANLRKHRLTKTQSDFPRLEDEILPPVDVLAV